MTNDALAFAKAMLEETGVAATPGVDFDAERGHRYLRFCYAGTTADMAEAARRLKQWASARRQRDGLTNRNVEAATDRPRLGAFPRLTAARSHRRWQCQSGE